MALTSMTGMGSSRFDAGGAGYVCIARSVNRRHLDVTMRLPPELAHMEPVLRAPVRRSCMRGDVTVVVERAGAGGIARMKVDIEAAAALFRGFEELAAAVGRPGDVPLEPLLSRSDILVPVHVGPLEPEVQDEVLAGVRAALDDLVQSRVREGAALHRDVSSRIEAVADAWTRLERMLPDVEAALRERARKRAVTLAEDVGIELEEAALASAVASIADKSDVSEEAARMRAHIQAFETAMEGEPPHGRKLDFLVQEMMREVGTTAAKAQSAAVSHVVVEIKSELERIREQLANVL